MNNVPPYSHPVKGKKKTWEQVNPHTSILLGGMSKVPIATAVVVGDSAGNASSNLATTQSAFSMPPRQGSQYDQFLRSDEYGKDYGRLHVSTPLNIHYLFSNDDLSPPYPFCNRYYVTI